MLYLEEKNIFHRDLKPANLLLNSKGELKIADFGLSRELKPKSKQLTVGIVTLCYRAPELILGDTNYNFKIDVWSAGCILAELMIGEPFFNFRGRGSQNHLQVLMDMMYQRLGTPTDEDWPNMKNLRGYNYFKPSKQYECRLKDYFFKRKPKVDKVALHLLEQMLKLNPDNRYTTAEALNHEFFKTEPLACDKSKLPKIENECHEVPNFFVMQSITLWRRSTRKDSSKCSSKVAGLTLVIPEVAGQARTHSS
jgi:cyclin-dependent kinase 12/13